MEYHCVMVYIQLQIGSLTIKPEKINAPVFPDVIDNSLPRREGIFFFC